MGCSVFSYGDTRMGCTDLDVELRISDGVSHLFKCTSCRKHGERTCKRNLSCRCKTRRNSHHISLCDSAVNVALRKCLLKGSCLCRAGKVRIQYNHVFMLFSKFYQSITVAFPCCDFL